MLSFSFYLTMVLFIIVCTFLMLLVLIQKGRGGGLASAFGGAGANTAFGSKTGDVLTWATSVVFGIFLVLAVALNLMADQMTIPQAPAPAATVLPTPTPAQPINSPPPAATEPALTPTTAPGSLPG